ncbi:MAG: hypothetical protein Crog4KO_29060 [Crocinitomicaceae bacterium]
MVLISIIGVMPVGFESGNQPGLIYQKSQLLASAATNRYYSIEKNYLLARAATNEFIYPKNLSSAGK